jgi:prepilin signal peptidase PulO-like enzyme (type II secretory pathway)
MTDTLILTVGAGVLGAILGSFLNALLFRFNTGKGMGGRSHCMRCNHTLGALDLVPVFSFAFLGGRCRYCGTKISAQYPLVELAAGLLSAELYLMFPDTFVFAFWLFAWLVVLFIFVYDLRHLIIPWSASLLLLTLSACSVWVRGVDPKSALIAGIALALPLFLLSLVSRGRWMGWADSLLELSFGVLLGFSPGLSALFIGIWSGALFGIGLIAYTRLTPSGRSHGEKRGFTIQSEIPFAPFLAFGAAVAFFFHVDFFNTLLLF